MRNERNAPGDKIRHNNFGTRGRESLIINQDWQARSLGPHPLVNILPQTVTESIRSSTQRPNPHLLAQQVPHIVNRIFQTTIPMGIRLEMPCLREENGEGRGQGHCVV